MLCYAIDPVLFLWTNRHICLIYLPQLSNFPLPACAAWPIQTRCTIYYLPSLPFLPSFHFSSLKWTADECVLSLSLSICLSVYQLSTDRWSPSSFLIVILRSEKPRGHGWEKTHFITRTLSLSLSVRPSVRVKDFFLSFPFHSWELILAGMSDSDSTVLCSGLLCATLARVYDMIRYDTTCYVFSS